MTRLHEVVAGIDGFDNLGHAEKLRLFAWVLHGDGKEHIKLGDFEGCFRALHLSLPGNIRRAVEALKQQKDLLPTTEGYTLSKQWRDRYQQKHGLRPITVSVHKALYELPARLTTAPQKEYLDEALRCFQVQSWRAAALMAWNLAFDHLCQKIVDSKLADFNAQYAKAYPKKPLNFAKRSDLQELKESDVIRIARAADVTDKTQHKCLERNLEIRNDIAHPSAVSFKQPQAENFILEVVQTVVLTLTP